MNGTILMGIEKFTQIRLGSKAWQEVIRQAKVPPRIYVPVADYPDQEVVALVTVLSAKTGMPFQSVLESLGEFVVPTLLKMSQSLIDPSWKTVDLIANTEMAIHEVVRKAETKNNPPELKCQRTSKREVTVTYTSPRKMCGLAKGIAKGLAKHYGEEIAIAEPTCMLKGGALCQLHIVVTNS